MAKKGTSTRKAPHAKAGKRRLGGLPKGPGNPQHPEWGSRKRRVAASMAEWRKRKAAERKAVEVEA